MLKIGDKVKVTYSNGDQFTGYLIGETEKTWKINYDGPGGKQRIRKSMQIELVDDPKTLVKEVVSIPSNVKESLESYKRHQVRSMNWRLALIVGVAVVLASIAILVGLDYLHLGAEGVYFTF